MKDYNDLMNELNELAEFVKEKDNSSEKAKKFVAELELDIETVKNSMIQIEKREALLKNTDEEDLKQHIGSTIRVYEGNIKDINSKYELFINSMKKTKEEEAKALEEAKEEEQEVKSSKAGKKLAIAGISVLAAGTVLASGIGLSNVATSMKNSNKDNSKSDDTKVEQASENDVTNYPIKDENGNITGYYDVKTNTVVPVKKTSDETKVVENEEIEITEDLINEVATTSANEINANLEGYGMTAETMAQMIKWINGVAVENPTEEEEMRIVREYLTLLGYDKDAKEPFDFSKLFLKPYAKKLAEDTYKVRKEVISATGTEKSEETADLMTELMAKTMNGLRDKEGDQLTNVISFHRLENAGSQLFILLANNYNYATLDNTRDGKYVDKDGFEYYSRQIFEAINTECVYTYEREDNVGAPGEGHERETVDLLTAIIYQTLNEAKEMSDVDTLTLK